MAKRTSANLLANPPTGLVVKQGTPPQRVLRNPTHNFHVRHRPFDIQPFLIAPVLPGETLDRALLNVRAITAPINNPIIGWWLEHYLFYVPLRALDSFADAEDMLLDVADPMPVTATTQWHTFHREAGSHKDWTADCLSVVVREFFREQDQTATAGTYTNAAGDTVNVAKFPGINFMDSFILDSEVAGGTSESTASDVEIEDLERKLLTYNMLMQQGLINMSYEDWCNQFGVKLAKEDVRKPELLRYMKAWQYPTNTINPNPVLDSMDEVILPAGSPTSAVSWAVQERVDKKRFFREPGFIFGVTIARPKVYLEQNGTAVGMLRTTFDWLPAMLNDKPEAALKKFAAADGPLGGTHSAAAYWLDVRDLFLYGENFHNFDPSTVDFNWMNVLSGGDHDDLMFPAQTDIDNLFVDNTADDKVKQDGIVSLYIKGTQIDFT